MRGVKKMFGVEMKRLKSSMVISIMEIAIDAREGDISPLRFLKSC